ncbi:MAG: SRPBCC domain-containing protein, partial [Bacillota bacterium]
MSLQKLMVRKQILVNASRERIWRALTDPSELNRWLTRSASLDLRVGGRIAPRLRLERSRSRL